MYLMPFFALYMGEDKMHLPFFFVEWFTASFSLSYKKKKKNHIHKKKKEKSREK